MNMVSTVFFTHPMVQKLEAVVETTQSTSSIHDLKDLCTIYGNF